jgi:ribosome-associated protein
MPDDPSPPRGLLISDELVIPDHELVWRFGPSGGPGGQHANTANTRAEVVFEIDTSAVLDAAQRARLSERFGPRIRVACDDHRSQHRNREVATDRLIERIRDGLRRPTVRRPTKPSRGSKERRLRAKRARSETKAQRRRPRLD